MSIATTALPWFSATDAASSAVCIFCVLHVRDASARTHRAGERYRRDEPINETILRLLAVHAALLGNHLASVACSSSWRSSDERKPGRAGDALGGIVYFLGMFACTIAFNVPPTTHSPGRHEQRHFGLAALASTNGRAGTTSARSRAPSRARRSSTHSSR